MSYLTTAMGVGQGLSFCKRKLYTVSLDDVERFAPFLRNCTLSKLAVVVWQGIAASPCAVSSIKDADVVVMPLYAAIDHWWPIYSPSYILEVHSHRPGRICNDRQTMEALQRFHAQNFPTRKVFFIDWFEGFGDKSTYDTTVYTNHLYIWGKLVSARPPSGSFREGIDISLPSGPHSRCSSARAAKALDEPLGAKKYFVTFKGKFRGTNPIRRTASALYHNGHDVIIVDSFNDAYDYDDLLFSTTFVLMMPGDTPAFSARYAETVCSGGIPVWVGWTELDLVSPFDSLIFGITYSLRVEELANLMTRLRSIGNEQVKKLRKNAKVACQVLFQTIEAQVAAISRALSGFRSSGNWARTSSPSELLKMGVTRASSQREADACPGGRLYAVSFDEAAQFLPQLHRCHKDAYAIELQKALMTTACATNAIQTADFIVLPAYALSKHSLLPTTARGGGCRENITFQAYRQLLHEVSFLRRKKLVVFETSDFSWSENGMERYYNRRGIIFAQRSLAPNWWPDFDIKLPTPLSPRYLEGVSVSSFLEPMHKKRFLLSFKGRSHEHPLQKEIAHRYHNGRDVLILDSTQGPLDDAQDVDLWDELLLESSVFNLILLNTNATIPRLIGAVCSGGVPVFVGDWWRPLPFESCTTFGSYGLRYRPSQMDELMDLLQQEMVPDRYQSMRNNARHACMLHFRSVKQHAESLASILTAQHMCHSFAGIGGGPAGDNRYATVLVNDAIILETDYAQYAVIDGKLARKIGNRPYEYLMSFAYITSIEIHDGILYGLFSNGLIYHQPEPPLTEQFDGTKWTPLAKPMCMKRIEVVGHVMFGWDCLSGNAYELDLQSVEFDRVWTRSSRTFVE